MATVTIPTTRPIDDRDDDREDEVPGDRERVAGRLPGGDPDGGGEQHQRGRVVDEPLALEHGQDPRRQAEPPADGGRRDRVGRAEHGTERDAGRQDQRGEHVEEDEAGAERGDHDEDDRQAEDRAEVPAEVDERQLDRGGVEDRRQQHVEHELGRHLDPRESRQVGQADADQDEEDRRGDAEPARERGDADDDGDRDDAGDLVHRQGVQVDRDRRGGAGQGDVVQHGFHGSRVPEHLLRVRLRAGRQARGGGRRGRASARPSVASTSCSIVAQRTLLVRRDPLPEREVERGDAGLRRDPGVRLLHPALPERRREGVAERRPLQQLALLQRGVRVEHRLPLPRPGSTVAPGRTRARPR